MTTPEQFILTAAAGGAVILFAHYVVDCAYALYLKIKNGPRS